MNKTEQLVRELFELTNRVECSDNNHYFLPTTLYFSSCRAMTGHRIGQILTELRTIVGVAPPISEKELHLLNYPNDCSECLGEGVGCKHCGGTGSTDPTVPMKCPQCKGTGDLNNHERESRDCPTCETAGRVKVCPSCNGSQVEGLDDCLDCVNGLIPVEDW